MADSLLFNKKRTIFMLMVHLCGLSVFLTNSDYAMIPSDWVLFSVLVVALILSNYFYLPKLPKGSSVSLDTAFYMASLFIFGIEETLFLLLLSNMLFALIRREIKIWKHTFNLSVYSLMISASYYVFIMFAGEVGAPIQPLMIYPYLFALIVYYTLNSILVSSYFYFLYLEKFGSVIKSFIKESFSNYFITLAFSYILAVILTDENPIFGVLIFTFIVVLLSIIFRKNHHLYEEISKDKMYREQILNSLPVGIITIEDENTTVDLNLSAEKLLNRNASEVKGYLVDNSEAHDKENRNFWGNVSSKKKYNQVKTHYASRDKNYLFLMSQTELIDQYDQLIGRIIYFLDVTDTENLEKRIGESESLAVLGQSAAGAAHEIRNPLTVIKGFLTLVEESLGDKDNHKFQIPLLLREIKRIDSIVGDMLLVAKPVTPTLEKVYLEDIVSDILPLYDYAITDQQVYIHVDLIKVPLLLDAKQITQVLYNLLRNSFDAIGEKGTVHIYSKVAGNYYQLYIEDSGPGIPPEYRDDLFEPFHTTKETGTGLGLTIVQRIVKNHHGTIELLPGKGATFRISFPIQVQ
ncbi:sensor histidine kinase [Salipaludibacillus neizhouensis]|uniref:histidine kinase n=1 Tax=Salipaludibacillus neizhouensis TaxID=885475 RepID=A0A3A9K5H0_9BACI|nr:ATP-binding protein [Salipaludibacillus neizhouensis]RKL66618.1 sensor histidine kinase [Salipaludibacillus neizhouensis]